MSAKAELLAAQRAWAHSQDLVVDSKGYVSHCDENLFQPLSANARRAFLAGGGSELSSRGNGAAKIQALHSSAALAVNFFDYWCGQDLRPIANALGFQDAPISLDFEVQFPTGLGGTPPNLDVVLGFDTSETVGIESKFTEWIALKRAQANAWKPKYFPEGLGAGLWADHGLPACQRLAEDLRAGRMQYAHLDAPQLLKHALGMVSKCGTGFRLHYLFFDVDGPEGHKHRADLADFEVRVGREISFAWGTYQALLERLEDTRNVVDADYCRYLRRRYSKHEFA